MIEVERLPAKLEKDKITRCDTIIQHCREANARIAGNNEMPAAVASKLPTSDESIRDLLDPNDPWCP